jgi:DNA-binding transcriptional ArsR family regulator
METQATAELRGSSYTKCPDWIWQKVSATSTVVYLAIRSHANESQPGAFPFPSISRLARLTRLHERSIYRALNELEAAGAITRRRQEGKATHYVIHADNPTLFEQHRDLLTPDTDDTPTPDTDDTLRRTKEQEPEHSLPHSSSDTDVSSEPVRDLVAQSAQNPPINHWETLAAIFGEPPNGNQQPAKGKRAHFARVVHLTEEHPVSEIPLRAERYEIIWPLASLTLAAFEKHWEYLGSRAAVTDAATDVERRQWEKEREQRARDRLTEEAWERRLAGRQT